MGQRASRAPFKVGGVGIGDISDVYINNLKTYDVVEVVGCAGRDLGKAKGRRPHIISIEPMATALR